jgi:hypothetical protein
VKASTRRGFLASLAALPFAGLLGLRPKKTPIVFAPGRLFTPGGAKKIMAASPDMCFHVRVYGLHSRPCALTWEGPRSSDIELVGTRPTVECTFEAPDGS